MGAKRVVRRKSPEAGSAAEESPGVRTRELRILERTVAKSQGNLFAEEAGGSSRVVIGLDASLTSYGVSVYAVDSGRHQTMLFKPKYKGARRLFEIWEFINLLARALESAFVVEEYVMEAYAMGIRGGQVFSIGEGGGATKLALVMLYGGDEKVAFPTLVSPGALKKFVTSKGTAKKNEILLAVYRKWGVDFGGQDDMADAYALARIGSALLSDATEHAYEHEVVNALERNTEWAPRS